jgi:hypothetical protein
VLAPAAVAEVWTTVYRCDETTPLAPADPNQPGVYRDIMVGTRLAIFINSDTDGIFWWGHLLLSWDDWLYGALSGRGYDEQHLNYNWSCLEAAGAGSYVADYNDPVGVGFQFTTGRKAVPGPWFVLDYRARQAGLCNVALYDGELGFGLPLETLSFRHVPSRDFDADGIVNFEDFALWARRWRSVAGPEPNGADAAFDLNSDARIDIMDLASFSEYWLERADCNEPQTDPNSAPVMP